MPLNEIAYREQAGSLEAVRASGAGRAASLTRRRGFAITAPALAYRGAALQLIQERAPHRFFAGVAEPDTAATLAARFPDARRQILCGGGCHPRGALRSARLPRSCRSAIPIDWHLEPVGSRRAPLVHWSRLDPLDPAVVGDSKVVWELNRHQWLVRLAQAWTLTGDPRYAAACVDAIDAWRERQSAGYRHQLGQQPRSGVPPDVVVLGVLLIRDAPVLSGEWATTLRGRHLAARGPHQALPVPLLLAQHASDRAKRSGCSMPGRSFPSSATRRSGAPPPRAFCWRRAATQIPPDGVHFEQSTCYQRYTIEIYFTSCSSRAQRGDASRRGRRAGAQRMVDFLLAVRRPDGSIPAIGDADGGELLPLVRRDRGRQPRRVCDRGRRVRIDRTSRGRPTGRRRKCCG